MPKKTDFLVPSASICIFLFLACILGSCIWSRLDGNFGYTLDDPYIHLALAERLAQGHYGINPGEFAAPSSSILWPFLLMIGVGTAWHPYWPLILNLLFGSLTMVMLTKIVEAWLGPADTPASRFAGIGLAALLMMAGNLTMLVFSGLEHNLEILLASCAGYAILRFWRNRPIPLWCLIAVALGPAIRYELLAPLLAVGCTLIGAGRWRDSGLLVLAGIIPPLAFGLYLTSHGLHFVPDSVLVKSDIYSAKMDNDGAGAFTTLVNMVYWHFREVGPAYWPVWGCAAMALGLFLAAIPASSRQRWALISAGIAIVPHLCFGRFNVLFRYEPYIIIFGLSLFMPAMAQFGEAGKLFFYTILGLFACFYAAYTPATPIFARVIYDQQYQLHRFLNEYYPEDTAILDLGWASYRQRTPFRILDLDGLGTDEALGHPRMESGWLDEITRRHNIKMVFLYGAPAKNAPADWTRVGTLDIPPGSVTFSGPEVTIFATPLGDAAAMRQALAAFAPSLPLGDRYIPAS